jgi:hypothetical protein
VALVQHPEFGVNCKFNLIPFNPFPESGLLRSKNPRITAFAQILLDAGIVTTIRKTRGDDIDAACGQLAGEVQDRTRCSSAWKNGRIPEEVRRQLRQDRGDPFLMTLAQRSRLSLVALCVAGALAGCASSGPGKSGKAELTTSDATAVQRKVDIRMQLAIGYFEQGQYAVALDEVKLALAADPNYADGYGMRA